MNQDLSIVSEPEELRLILAGLGGQGVIFMTHLLAQTAMDQGHSVIVTETHGMSQRGGSVISHLRVGGSEAPLIRRGTADVLLGLEADEAVRNLSFLRRGGIAFVNSNDGLRPEVAEHLERLDIKVQSLPATSMALEIGSAAVTNVVLTGFAVAHPSMWLSIDALRETLVAIAPRGRDLNLQALEAGYRAGNDYVIA
jgi:indolepyruvate ferredoxin oxidoreductase beta subunit